MGIAPDHLVQQHVSKDAAAGSQHPGSDIERDKHVRCGYVLVGRMTVAGGN